MKKLSFFVVFIVLPCLFSSSLTYAQPQYELYPGFGTLADSKKSPPNANTFPRPLWRAFKSTQNVTVIGVAVYLKTTKIPFPVEISITKKDHSLSVNNINSTYVDSIQWNTPGKFSALLFFFKSESNFDLEKEIFNMGLSYDNTTGDTLEVGINQEGDFMITPIIKPILPAVPGLDSLNVDTEPAGGNNMNIKLDLLFFSPSQDGIELDWSLMPTTGDIITDSEDLQLGASGPDSSHKRLVIQSNAFRSEFPIDFKTLWRSYKMTDNGRVYSAWDSAETTIRLKDGDGNEIQIPKTFLLNQNYPNPFNPQTTIRYGIPEGEAQQVSLKIYNLLGQEIITLVGEVMEPGLHEVTWDGKDYAGRVVASGIYIYHLQAGSFADTKKMLLNK